MAETLQIPGVGSLDESTGLTEMSDHLVCQYTASLDTGCTDLTAVA